MSDPNPLVAAFQFDGASYRALVREVTDQGAVLTLSRGDARSLPLGEPLELELRGGSLRSQLKMGARPTRWHAEAEGDALEVELDPGAAWRMQNAMGPRRTVRVPVRGSRAVRVCVEDLDSRCSVEAALVDLSPGGVGLILAPQADATLAGVMKDAADERKWRVDFSFLLPEGEGELRLIGEVRYRRLQRGYVKLGIELDLEATEAAHPGQVTEFGRQLEAFGERLRAA